MKKVLLVHNLLWSHYKAKVFSELYKLVKESDVNFYVIQIASTNTSRKKLGNPDPSLHQYPYTLLFDKAFAETSVFERSKALILQIKKHKPDVCILYGYYDPASWIATLYLRQKGIKIIQSVDSVETDYRRNGLKEKFKSKILGYADLVYCYGNLQKAYLKKLAVPEEKIHIRIQATDNKKVLDSYQQKSTLDKKYPKKCFIYVGRYSSEKNLVLLINTFLKVESDWGLILVGSGSERNNLEKLIQEKETNKIFLEGPKPWDEVIEFYKYASVFVLPSTREPWGLVVNEAMLCSLPVLVSNHCGSSAELVLEGENGFVFDPYNEKELLDKMNYFTSVDDLILKKMGERSKQHIQYYSPERAATQMLDGIKKLLK